MSDFTVSRTDTQITHTHASIDLSRICTYERIESIFVHQSNFFAWFIRFETRTPNQHRHHRYSFTITRFLCIAHKYEREFINELNKFRFTKERKCSTICEHLPREIAHLRFYATSNFFQTLFHKCILLQPQNWSNFPKIHSNHKNIHMQTEQTNWMARTKKKCYKNLTTTIL